MKSTLRRISYLCFELEKLESTIRVSPIQAKVTSALLSVGEMGLAVESVAVILGL